MVHVRSRATLIVGLVLASSPAFAASGLQVTPDGTRTLVVKDVGDERWAIVRSAGDVSGNVYFPDGSDPKFVYCPQTGSESGNLTFSCSGADRCESAPCPDSDWSTIGDVTLPESFFLPDTGGAARAKSTGAGRTAADAAGSGLQITPGDTSTLVNKDLEGERWSIARFPDGVVTGIVYLGEAADPTFVYCEQTGTSGGNIQLQCSGADSCKAGPCVPEDWDEIGAVSVPESFFAPPAQRQITPDNAAELELAWDFPAGAGVTAGPVVTDDFVYVGSWDNTLYALDPRTGALKWQFRIEGGGIQGQVTLLPSSSDILIGDGWTTVYRLDGRTGDVRWQTRVGDQTVDQIWSAVAVGGGRVFAGIASHSDNPCTNGRTAALDLESGDLLWERQNVPERICKTDTAISCEDASDCPANGECVQARGAGVTAAPVVSDDGKSVYVNTVGCYTFPSIGDEDAIMKLDAATGETKWLNRVVPPEQFGACAQDKAIDCGTDAACGAKGPCQTKGAYHDFGFLNGPLLLDIEDSRGRPQKVLVSGAKHGTLYAFDEKSGDIVWENKVLPLPTPPGFAGFGLFDGAIAYENGRLYAALFQMIPAANPEPPHLQAFDVQTGETVWTAEIGRAYAHVGVKNDVLFTGTNDVPDYYVYDAARGVRLKTFQLPATSASKTAVAGDTAYVGYGILSNVGGVRAYRLPAQ
jgi:outer membrane protein assembly factor BamB